MQWFALWWLLCNQLETKEGRDHQDCTGGGVLYVKQAAEGISAGGCRVLAAEVETVRDGHGWNAAAFREGGSFGRSPVGETHGNHYYLPIDDFQFYLSTNRPPLYSQ